MNTQTRVKWTKEQMGIMYIVKNGNRTKTWSFTLFFSYWFSSFAASSSSFFYFFQLLSGLCSVMVFRSREDSSLKRPVSSTLLRSALRSRKQSSHGKLYHLHSFLLAQLYLFISLRLSGLTLIYCPLSFLFSSLSGDHFKVLVMSLRWKWFLPLSLITFWSSSLSR